jgi:hypothetical protein
VFTLAPWAEQKQSVLILFIVTLPKDAEKLMFFAIVAAIIDYDTALYQCECSAEI